MSAQKQRQERERVVGAKLKCPRRASVNKELSLEEKSLFVWVAGSS